MSATQAPPTSGRPGQSPPAWTPPPAYAPPPRPRRTGVVLFWPTLALIAIALGTLGIYDAGNHVVASAYAALALGISVVAAVFGAVTVTERNTAWATASHKIIAVTLLATLAATYVRAGGFGAVRALAASGTAKAMRGATIAAGLALAAVLMGAFTAKVEGAVAACLGFPACTRAYDGAAAHIQLTHRGVAYLLALHVAAADVSDRAALERLVQDVQDAAGKSVEVACVDQGDTGEQLAAAAARHAIRPDVVKLPEAKRGVVLLPRRRVVERSLAWATRRRRLVRDYTCFAQTRADMHTAACSRLRLRLRFRLTSDLDHIHNTFY